MVRAECDVARPFRVCPANLPLNTNSLVSAKLPPLPAWSGERGEALAAACNAPPVPATQQIVQEIKGLPTRTLLLLHRPPVSNLFLSQIVELIPITLKRMPRLSEPGALCMRAKHWYDFGDQAGDSNLVVQVVAHIAAAAVPPWFCSSSDMAKAHLSPSPQGATVHSS